MGEWPWKVIVLTTLKNEKGRLKKKDVERNKAIFFIEIFLFERKESASFTPSNLFSNPFESNSLITRISLQNQILSSSIVFSKCLALFCLITSGYHFVIISYDYT